MYLDTCVFVKVEFEEGLSSNVARVLSFMTKNKVFSSSVAFGEFIGVLGRKESKEKEINTIGYLVTCRRLMVDFDMKQINQVEPVADRFNFLTLAQTLSTRYPHLGGGDLWQLMAALNLRGPFPAAILISFDRKLIEAARQEGISSVDANALDIHELERRLRAATKLIGT